MPNNHWKTIQKKYLSVLENSFFLNLGVLAAGTLYIRLVGGSQEALVTTCVGIAFLQFVGIVIFHIVYFVITPLKSLWAEMRDYFKSKNGHTARSQLELTVPIITNTGTTHTSVHFHRLQTSDMLLTSTNEELCRLPNTETSDPSSTETNQEPLQEMSQSLETSDIVARETEVGIAGLKESEESPRYFAATKRFNSFSSPREALLFTQK